MDPTYKTEYAVRRINPTNLQKKIGNLFHNYSRTTQYTFDQILFILDQKCQNGKCDRDVVRELFQQSANAENKANLNQIIFKYAQNVETSKLCLMREEKSKERIQNKMKELKDRKRSYIFLKIIQATVHARYSSVPSFSYKIQPSDIPPVTIVNSLNPVLNHEYTLQLQTQGFKLVFFESGIKIQQWEWPDSLEAEKEGEYHRNIMSQKVSFELKIKYKPKGSNSEKILLQKQLMDKNKKINLQRNAFEKLCQFEPFLDPTLIKNQQNFEKKGETKLYQMTENLFQFLPFLRHHLRNLYYILILLIIFECLASISWGMEFLDIALSFAVISMLFDQGQIDMGMQMLITMVGMLLLIIKSIWGAVVTEEGETITTFFLFLCIAIKIMVIFLAWIVSIRKEQILQQRKQYFYDGVDPHIIMQKQVEKDNEEQINIYYPEPKQHSKQIRI